MTSQLGEDLSLRASLSTVLNDLVAPEGGEVTGNFRNKKEGGHESASLLLRLPTIAERQLIFSFMDIRTIGTIDSVMMLNSSSRVIWKESLAGAFSPALSNYQGYSNDNDDFKSLRWCLRRRINLDGMRLSRIKVDGGPDLIQPVKQFDWLVKNDKAEIATCLLQSGGVDPNRVSGGLSLLHLACSAGMQEVVDSLIDLGARLDRKVTKTGATAMHLAAQRGSVGVMRALFNAGIDCNKVDKTKSTPLHHACANGHIEASLFLIQQAGAEFEYVDNDEATPLLIAAGSASDDTSAVMQVQTLVQAGADVSRANKQGTCPLAAAAQAGDLESVECLIEGGADVNRSDKNGLSPLYLACQEGHLRCCLALLREGAQFDYSSTEGGTCLSVASAFGHVPCVQALLSAGAEVDKMNSSVNFTPLHLACLGGHKAVAEVLLEAGAAINAKGGRGGLKGTTTPLGCALEVKCNAVVTLLRSKGAHT